MKVKHAERPKRPAVWEIDTDCYRDLFEIDEVVGGERTR